MYFRLSWKTWKALFIELVSFFYCIYFLLLLVIWLSVEKMFSTEPIVAFLDLCSCYIFWLHLWVNKNVDGCLKYVYNMIISIYWSIYSCIESYNFFEISANIVSLGMRIDIVSNRDKPSDLHPYKLGFVVQNVLRHWGATKRSDTYRCNSALARWAFNKTCLTMAFSFGKS